ncbi:hypothetical protein HDU91_000518 [Kappamyces sp. JEL0680]|nr:hypothetical protein HDU91_000518 [Kappamyces sp. JEL0680]
MLQLAVLALMAVVQGQVANRTYSLLENSRDKFTFVPYTAEQRADIAQDLNNMFSLYVHREKKIQSYDAEYKAFSGQSIDPVPRIKAVGDRAKTMTDQEFHYAYLDIFNSLRDLHTNYEMPAPHVCFSAIQPFNVIATKSGVTVLDVSTNPTWLKLAPEARSLSAGDTILSINGKTFEEFEQSVKWDTGGNDESGMLRGALYHLTFRSGMFSKPPVENKVTYEVKALKDGSKYTVTLPWIVSQRDDCLANYNAAMAGAGAKAVGQKAAVVKSVQDLSAEKRQELKKNSRNMANKRLTLRQQEIPGSRPVLGAISMHDTADDIVKWGLYAPKNMGVIQLTSFVPVSAAGDAGVFQIIRDLLLNELKDTDSVLMDLRDNGGGDITLADILPQLFGGSRPFEPNAARGLTGHVADNLFAALDPSDAWYNASQKAAPGDKYTPLIQFTTVAQANTFGVAYVKPVGILNNGNCFSACDLFSANVQDNEIATVFGEDKFTGAGGANVVVSQARSHG